MDYLILSFSSFLLTLSICFIYLTSKIINYNLNYLISAVSLHVSCGGGVVAEFLDRFTSICFNFPPFVVEHELN